jgi:hypothetical protein
MPAWKPRSRAIRGQFRELAFPPLAPMSPPAFPWAELKRHTLPRFACGEVILAMSRELGINEGVEVNHLVFDLG